MSTRVICDVCGEAIALTGDDLAMTYIHVEVGRSGFGGRQEKDAHQEHAPQLQSTLYRLLLDETVQSVALTRMALVRGKT